MSSTSSLPDLAESLLLGPLLSALSTRGGYELLDHWQQGEFHHDLLLRLPDPAGYLVVATNCNGGLKELLRFDSAVDRWALWHWRCPDNPEFEGELPPVRERLTTVHFFDPCELLLPDARSEIRPEFRERMRGGGWALVDGDGRCKGNS
jgi:hypothetical protein